MSKTKGKKAPKSSNHFRNFFRISFLVLIVAMVVYYFVWDLRPIKLVLLDSFSFLLSLGMSEDTEASIIQLRHRFALGYSDMKNKFPGIEDRNITFPDGFKNPIRIYHPKGYQSTTNKLGLFLYFHSGGFCIGSHTDHDPFMYELALESNMVVISIHYRLAPENKFPIGLNDAYHSVEWIFDHIDEFKGDRDKVIIAGESAGANLATVISIKARDTKKFHFIGQFLSSPLLDSNFERESYLKYAKGYLLTRETMIKFFTCLAPKEKWSDPLISPIRTKNLKDLPPTLILVSEYDTLRDEALEYAELLQKNGVSVDLHIFEKTPHAHVVLLRDFYPQESQEGFQRLINWIRKLIK